MTMNVREKLNDGRLGIGIGIAMIAIAAVAIYLYVRPTSPRVNATELYYSDDDGASYYKDSVYNFPPYDHNGKTAYQVMVFDDGGKHFIGYLVRYTPAAHKQLVDRYNDALSSHLSDRQLQQQMLDFKDGPIMSWQIEVKLPGPGNKWLPRSAISSFQIKGPSGELPDGIVYP
jgi:hypothetical protein